MRTTLIRSHIRRVRRKLRVKNKLRKNIERPRIVVFRSNKHISAQIVDDGKNMTLVSFSDLNITVDKEKKLTKSEKAQKVGAELAVLALKKKIKEVVFDRGCYRYHGRVKLLAEAARKGGLIF